MLLTRTAGVAVLATATLSCASAFGPCPCGTSEPPTDDNLLLYVSNQSFAVDPVDMLVRIDGAVAVRDNFEVGSQHNWIRFSLRLAAGSHTVSAASSQAPATADARFDLADGERIYCVVNYWYSPKRGPDAKRRVTVDCQKQPPLFV